MRICHFKYRRGRGEYLYKIDPITKKQTLIEFIPEETNNLNNKNE